MRSPVCTAVLVTVVGLGQATLAGAQDPEPVPAARPAPVPQAVGDFAVPRTEAPQPRDAESRVEDRSEGARRADPATQGARTRDRQRAGSERPTAPADAGAQNRRRVPPASAPRVASEGGEPQRERPGAVRRPRSGRGGEAGDRAVPRTAAPRPPARVLVYPDYYRNYNRYYDPWGYGAFGLGYFYYSPWGWNPSYGGYAPYGGYGYGPSASGYGHAIGSVKLKVKPRDAEVYVDGYFAGHVDDFDGILQGLKLDSGAYQIEVRKPGYQSLQFDVMIQPGRTITYRGELNPAP
ncbi:MAG: PEGA domain-containing protein [Acidobacteriota bacterium]